MNRPPPREITGLPARFFTRRRLIALLVIVATAAAAGIFLGPAAMRARTTRQIHALRQQALKAARDGDTENAAALMQAAYAKRPDDPETMRMFAGFLDAQPGGSEQAAYLLNQLVQNGVATTADRAALGLAFLRTGRILDARTALDAIPKIDRTGRAALELEAAILMHDGHREEAARKLRAAYLADPGDPSSRVNLAVLDLGSPFREIQEGAENTLWAVARSGEALAPTAMDHLARLPSLPAPRAAELASLIRSAAKVPDALRYRVLAASIRALPAEKQRIIAEEAARLGPAAATSPEFLGWLVAHGESHQVLTLLDAAAAAESPALFSVYASAMDKEHRWAELQDVVRRKTALPLTPLQSSLLLAQCAAGLKAPAKEIRAHLEEALKLASGQTARTGILAVGNAAEALGQNEIAIRALARLAEQPQSRLPMLDRILQIQQRERDVPAMLATVGKCLEERPGISPYLETSCYLRLLTGLQIELASLEAARLDESVTRSGAAVHLLRALAAFRFGDLRTAEAECASVSAAKLPAGQRAVLSGILSVCGKKAEAFQLAEKIPESLLLQEESVFLARAL